MDMGVHTDPQLPESHRQDQVGGLSTHPGKGQKIRKARGNLSLEAPQEVLANLMDPLGLRPIESHRIDQGANLFQGQAQQLLGGSRPCKKSGRGLCRYLILGP